MPRLPVSSEFIHYLASMPGGSAPETEHMPSLLELSKSMGVSVASLREQLEVARALGLVEVRPRTGIRRLPYTFLPAVRQSLFYAIELEMQHFYEFARMRDELEQSFWNDAVCQLVPEDHQVLKDLMVQAWEKLNGTPVQIPHDEHRRLHLVIYSRLKNPFVLGILEAYWEAYEAVGLNLYADFGYLQQVWWYHQAMVDSICSGDFEPGYNALVAHKDLLHHRWGISTT